MDLSFSKYIKGIISYVSFRLSHLSRMRKYITVQTAAMLYKSMILSIMDYGSIFYSSANYSSIKKLQTLQIKAIRIILKLPKMTNTDNSHKELGLQLLEERRYCELMALAFKFSCDEKHLLKNNIEIRVTWANDPGRRQLTVFTPKNSICKRSFSFRLRRDWNNLPKNLHHCSSRKELTNLLVLYAAELKNDNN